MTSENNGKTGLKEAAERLGDPEGKTYREIAGLFGEPRKTVGGDPLFFLPGSRCCLWRDDSFAITLYFDINDICLGNDANKVFLPSLGKFRSSEEEYDSLDDNPILNMLNFI